MPQQEAAREVMAQMADDSDMREKRLADHLDKRSGVVGDRGDGRNDRHTTL